MGQRKDMDRIQWAIKGRKVSFSCGTMAESSCRLGVNAWFTAAVPRYPHDQGPPLYPQWISLDPFLILERQGANLTPLEGQLCVREKRSYRYDLDHTGMIGCG